MVAIADIIESPNADHDCCDRFCRALFIQKARDLTWDFVDSIMEHGFLDNIVYDVDRGYMKNGNHRLAAAILLGIDDVDVDDDCWGYSDSGPSGWPHFEDRECFHVNPDPDEYVFADPKFAKIIMEFASGLSDCPYSIYQMGRCCW